MDNVLEGYASVASAAPGDTIEFRIRADAAHRAFKLDIYRRGVTDTPLHTAAGEAFVPGTQDDAQLAVVGCDWPSDPNCRIVVPSDWKSGYYVGIATSGDVACTMPFVVRAGTPNSSGILVKLGDTTAQAYNAWGGRSLYSTPFAPVVTFDRPADVGLYEKYQLPFLQWAQKSNVSFDLCSSLDLHGDPMLLGPYRLFISLGHDEYWSLEMRDAVEAFVAAGGNAAFFSANTCFWQIRLDLASGSRSMTCYKEGEAGHVPDPERGDPSRITCRWFDSPVLRPENAITGVSYRNGAGWWINPVVPARRFRGYTVLSPQHPFLRGTALALGDVFGAGTTVDDAILGYETDAALLDGVRPIGTDGTPATFVPLATADLRDWAPNGQGGFATMGTYRRFGTALTVGTVNWAGGLVQGSVVERITQNVLADLVVAPRTIPVANADFEEWVNGSPANWIRDGAGFVAARDLAADVLANQCRFTQGGSHALEIDASDGDTWLGQPNFSLELGATYGIGCWAQTSAPGATIRLQTTDSWTDFASATHSGNGRWEYLFAVGSIAENRATPFRVKLQVAQGGIALFARISLVRGAD